MPARAIEVTSGALSKVLADDAVQQRLRAQGITPIGSSPAELSRWVRNEYDKWGRVIRERGLKGS